MYLNYLRKFKISLKSEAPNISRAEGQQNDKHLHAILINFTKLKPPFTLDLDALRNACFRPKSKPIIKSGF